MSTRLEQCTFCHSPCSPYRFSRKWWGIEFGYTCIEGHRFEVDFKRDHEDYGEYKIAEVRRLPNRVPSPAAGWDLEQQQREVAHEEALAEDALRHHRPEKSPIERLAAALLERSRIGQE